MNHNLLAVAPRDPSLTVLVPAIQKVLGELIASGNLSRIGVDGLSAEGRQQRAQSTLDKIPSSPRGSEWTIFRGKYLRDAPSARKLKHPGFTDSRKFDTSGTAFSRVERKRPRGQ